MALDGSGRLREVRVCFFWHLREERAVNYVCVVALKRDR